MTALLAAFAGAVDLLGGADARWAVGAYVLLLPAALVLAGEVASGEEAMSVTVLAAAGILVAPTGAWLGDAAGTAIPWLGLVTLWWFGVAIGLRRWRPGLALLSAVAGGASALAAVLLALAVPLPISSLAGARAALAVAWMTWAGAELLARPTCRSDRALPRDRSGAS